VKVFITGIAGFIGSHMAEALQARGDTVLGIDNFNDYYDPQQKRNNCDLLHAKHIAVLDMDLRSREAYDAIVWGAPDVIIHLGAMAGVRNSIAHPSTYMDVNVVGTQNILNAAAKCGSYVVAASSSSVYGDRTDVPFKETDRVDAQVSPYAASKRSMELICQVHTQLTGLPVSCLRFFTVYGPRGRPDMAPYSFMRRIMAGEPIEQYGDGTSARDYTYVGDIVAGILLAIDKPDGFQIYNLGHSSPVTLAEFIRLQEEVCGKKAILKKTAPQPGDVMHTYADITKAQQKLGFKPKTSLKEGLTKQHEWFKTCH
jgi:UDP-glucuronate 4-epimerase